MQIRILSLLLFIHTLFIANAQVNTQLLGQLDINGIHNTGLNDVWGYVDEDGNEYALVGANDGTSVVDVTDPNNPVELFWEPGMNSVWRDIKTFGDYAYVTTEAENGLLIIDLGPLPQSTVLPTYYYNGTLGDEWSSAHNLYIEEATGHAYIFGANRDNGGTIILDLNPNPTQPVEVGSFEDWYCHDGFVRNDTAFLAHISDGIISIVDVTDKSNPQLLGTSTTPTNLSHNIWTSDDNNYAYTTDETQGGYLTAYDVSNPANITEIDRTKVFPEDNIIPHNTHVMGDYIITSYYTAGLRVHDITQRNNMIEVADYDSSPLSSPSYNGAWGAYPYLPSGNVLVTDIEEGLFVIGVNYQQASYLEGNVTDISNGNNLEGVKVVVLAGTNNDKFSNLLGNYTSGTLQSGTYDIGFYKVGYDTLIVDGIQLDQGLVTVLDTALTPIPTFPVTVNVLEMGSGNPIQDAQVSVVFPIIDYLENTNGLGQVDLDLFYEGDYEITAGKWGYKSECLTFDFSATNNSIDIYLKKEFYDDFTFDFGWSTLSTADRGDWVRVEPIEVYDGFAETYENPASDVENDCGTMAFLTGNGPLGFPGGGDVKNGTVTLISPVFDLTDYSDPYLSVHSFFFNFHGFDPPNDTLKMFISNGNTVEMIGYKTYEDSLGVWVNDVFRIEDLITPTPFMQFSMVLSDEPATENIAKGGLDRFHITNGNPSNVEEISTNELKLYPNPANGKVFIDGAELREAFKIFSLSGRLLREGEYSTYGIEIEAFSKGIYIIQLSSSDQPLKLVKE